MIEIKNVDLSEVEGIVKPILEEQVKEDKILKMLALKGSFSGKEGEIYTLPLVEEEMKYMIYIGMGTAESLTAETLRRQIAKAVEEVQKLKLKEVGIKLCLGDALCVGGNVKAITEGILLGSYTFDKYKKEKKECLVNYKISDVPEAKLARASQVLEEMKNVAEGVIVARDLTNEPSNHMTPEKLAEFTLNLGKEIGLEVQVMDETEIKKLGMEAFLAVGASSKNKPRLIVMRHKGGNEGDEVLGLVGKGLTYDTGGYSLKPTESMKTMYSDMGGAAAVIGAMQAISKNKVAKNIVAVVAACENVISNDSFKPGDIISSMLGKTIEITNTDAEGRLTLADAVTYAIEKEKVTKIIDVATLTGAALVALGTTTTAVISNSTCFYNELMEASNKTGERFWRLPEDKAYKQLNKSTVADLKNSAGRQAGTITAGLFIGEFVKDLPWLHLDIAGTGWSDTKEGYLSKGGTGVPVRTLYAMVAAPCPCGHHK